MERRINPREHAFAFIAVSTVVAGLTTAGVLRANLEYEESFHDAAKDECIQLEGQRNAIEREKEGIGCHREGPPPECDSLWKKQEEHSQREEECYKRLNSVTESGNDCSQMNEVFMQIEREKEALDCFSNEAPAECDALTQKFDEHSRVMEECYNGMQSQKEGAEAECKQMGDARMGIEEETRARGCYDSELPEECGVLWEKQEAVEKEIRNCFERIQDRDRYDDHRDYPVKDEFIDPAGKKWYPEERNDCSEIKRLIEQIRADKYEVCGTGEHPEKCRSMEDELSRVEKKLRNCGQGSYPGDQGRPFPPPPPPWQDHPRPPEPVSDCGFMHEKMRDIEGKAREVCYAEPKGEECRERKNHVQDMAREIDGCEQGGRPPYQVMPHPMPMPGPGYREMPPPPPWQDDGQFRPPQYGRDGGGMYMDQPYRGEDQHMQRPFSEERPDEYMDVMLEQQFRQIISEARKRLEEALKFVDEDMKDVIKEAITALDVLENKFASESESPTHEDIEQIIHKLEGVKRVVQEGMHSEERFKKDDRGRMDQGPRSQGPNYQRGQGPSDHRGQGPSDHRPQRDVDDIVEEISKVVDKLIPRVFEIFEEEGESVSADVKEAFEEARSAFNDVLPICRGGELKRRVCAAAMQEVFLILEEDMRPFVEEHMRSNERLRERVEELFEEFDA